MLNWLLAVCSIALFACSCAGAAEVSDDDMQAKYAASAHEALQRGDYPFAESALSEVFKTLSKKDGLDDAIVAAMYVDLGDAQRGQQKMRDALNSYKKAEKLLQASTARHDETTAALSYGLAAYWLVEDKPEKALPFAQQAYELRKQLNSQKLWQSARQLAELKLIKALPDDATTLFKEAIDANEQTTHGMPVTADIMEELAALKQQQGNSEEANRLFEQARTIKENTGAIFRQWAPQPLTQQVTFFYNSNNPSSGRPAGSTGFAMTANDVTLTVEPRDKPSMFFATTRIMITINNDSAQTVTVLSQPPSLSTLQHHSKEARYLEPELVAEEIEKRGQSKANDLKYTSEHATMSQSTTTNISQYRPGQGYILVPTTRTIQVPDYDARARARLLMDQTISQYLAEATYVRTQSLHTLFQVQPKSTVSAFVDFSRLKYKQARLRVPVGNAVFEFVLAGDDAAPEAEQKLLLKHD